MKAIIPVLSKSSARSYYLQLYDYIKHAILSGEMMEGERLPSLRNLSKSLKLSLTTVELAYNQLAVEGYIYSKPQSGFFVSNISYGQKTDGINQPDYDFTEPDFSSEALPFQYDLSCFDFNKWKKCVNKVLTEYPELLLFESDSQGEPALRLEISKYLYRSRGVIGSPDQIVIGAGTQQITGQLSLLLKKLSIGHVAVEEPGYLPVQNIFRDRGFVITPVGVGKDGIHIQKLPTNIRSAAYVSPSNQFPTGAVMPIGKRYELLEWANRNDSVIIEDDYDSELRYFGKPVPALQGLDSHQCVVYLGSFSSTLFPSIKISYMVLPPPIATIFQAVRSDYTQTCSKMEQLTLSLFMEHGLYQTNIRKLRSLYSQKLQTVLSAMQKYGKGFITPTNASSGINMIINVKSDKSTKRLCEEAYELGVSALPVAIYTDDPQVNTADLIFYYNQIPLERIDATIEALVCKWRKIFKKD